MLKLPSPLVNNHFLSRHTKFCLLFRKIISEDRSECDGGDDFLRLDHLLSTYSEAGMLLYDFSHIISNPSSNAEVGYQPSFTEEKKLRLRGVKPLS